MPLKIDIKIPRQTPHRSVTPEILTKPQNRRRPPPPKSRGQPAVMNGNMDPDCAICSHPAAANCECEANALDTAIKQAEQKMMASVFSDIRYGSIPSLIPRPFGILFVYLVKTRNANPLFSSWVRAHAQDYILSFFTTLSDRRRHLHAQQIQAITVRAYNHYRLPPHPSELLTADAELKRGIDEDWKSAVQRYPEVLEYYYNLVDLSLPSDSEEGVRDPPLSALVGGAGPGKTGRIRGSGRERRRSRIETTVEMGGGERRRRGQGVAFAPMPGGYGYVYPSNY